VPAGCCFVLGNGSKLSLKLGGHIFIAMTETQRRDFNSRFDSEVACSH
jgi:hypothetical protein